MANPSASFARPSLAAILGAALIATCVPVMAQGTPTPTPTAHRWAILHGGTLLTDAGTPTRTAASVIVKDGRIDRILDGYVGAESLTGAAADEVEIVELRDKFVMPGMIDAHNHLSFPSHSLVEALERARRRVRGGATTVRDAGSVTDVIFPLRDAINNGYFVGPRILSAGAPITTTGGHGDPRNGSTEASLREPEFSGGICDGVEECQKVTRRQIQLGADLIKIIGTAGVSDNSDTGLDQQFTDAEMRAIIEVAHLMNRKVMVHAHGADGIKAAVRAGADSIEHGTFLDEEGARLMKQHGTFLVPTLQAAKGVIDLVEHPQPGEPTISENSKKKFLRLPDAQPGGAGLRVKLAARHGVKMATGVDVTQFSIGSEVVAFVKEGGMTPRDALIAATSNGAALLGISQETGTITPGKAADIVALDGNPLTDIENCTKVAFVMAQGRVAVSRGKPVIIPDAR